MTIKQLTSLFVVIFSLFGLSVYANKPLVGFLYTQCAQYPRELGKSVNIPEMLNKLGAETIIIDYNQLARGSENIENSIRGFIKKQGIKRVIIPGNYYNLNTEPYPPNTNRQDATAVVTKMANEGEIYLMGICGGLQGIMYAEGIKLTGVDSFDLSNHTLSEEGYQEKNVALGRVKVTQDSRIAQVLSKHKKLFNKGGSAEFYTVEAHHNMVDNNSQNIEKLHQLGYKVVGHSKYGVIEAIEDRFGNIHFQGHPEGLVITSQKYGDACIMSSLRQSSVDASISIFEDFINR